MKILLIGDTHGNLAYAEKYILKAMDYRPDISAAIQVGDFGFYPFVFNGLRAAKRKFPVPVYAIDGNHENHVWLHKNAHKWNTDWPEQHNLTYQPRGSVLEVENLTGSEIRIGFVGGAMNVDRPQEGSIDKRTTNYMLDVEADEIADKWNENPVDIVIAHSCPHSIGVKMRGEVFFLPYIQKFVVDATGKETGPIDDCGEEVLTYLWSKLKQKPKHWVFGHFHKHHYNYGVGGKTDFWCVGLGDKYEYCFYILDTLTNEIEKVVVK